MSVFWSHKRHRKWVERIVPWAIATLPPERRDLVSAGLAEQITPIVERATRHGTIKFYCPSIRTHTRAHKLLDKEPDTIAWIEAMPPGSVLWDIGANVGVYTLFAAIKHLTVCAFEPEAANFFVLQRNLDLNCVQNKVTALNVAIGDTTGLVNFAIPCDVIGASRHQVVTAGGRRVQAFTARDAAAQLGLARPEHIKIDVDGYESAVMRGIDLTEQSLRSVLIELHDNEEAASIIEMFQANGFVSGSTLKDIEQNRGKATNFIFRRP